MVHIGLLKVYSRLTAQVHLTHSAKLTIDPFSFILHMFFGMSDVLKRNRTESVHYRLSHAF